MPPDHPLGRRRSSTASGTSSRVGEFHLVEVVAQRRIDQVELLGGGSDLVQRGCQILDGDLVSGTALGKRGLGQLVVGEVGRTRTRVQPRYAPEWELGAPVRADVAPAPSGPVYKASFPVGRW
jgi:hypothetical protein